MMYGMKISYEGDDVKTTENPLFVTTSGIYNIFKSAVVRKYSDGTGLQSIIIPHNLGYIPAVDVYQLWFAADNFQMRPSYMGVFGFVIYNGDVLYNVDDTNLTIKCYDETEYGDPPYDRRYWDVKYTIAYNKISD